MARSKTRTSRRSVRAARRPARLIQEEDPEPLMEEVEEPLDQEPVIEQDDDEDAEEVFNDFVGNDGGDDDEEDSSDEDLPIGGGGGGNNHGAVADANNARPGAFTPGLGTKRILWYDEKKAHA